MPPFLSSSLSTMPPKLKLILYPFFLLLFSFFTILFSSFILYSFSCTILIFCVHFLFCPSFSLPCSYSSIFLLLFTHPYLLIIIPFLQPPHPSSSVYIYCTPFFPQLYTLPSPLWTFFLLRILLQVYLYLFLYLCSILSKFFFIHYNHTVVLSSTSPFKNLYLTSILSCSVKRDVLLPLQVKLSL